MLKGQKKTTGKTGGRSQVSHSLVRKTINIVCTIQYLTLIYLFYEHHTHA